MDHCLCSCQTGKCKAHMYQMRQRAFVRQHCPSALYPNQRPPTKALADSNGRLLNPQHKCCFPWSNYLMEQWYSQPCSCSNACGMKHLPSNTKNLPSYFKNPPSKTNSDDDSMLHCDSQGHAVWRSNGNEKSDKVTEADHFICQAFKALKDKRLPVIWVFGHAHMPANQTRHQFCRELAAALGFLHLNMDYQIRHGTDKLFHTASTEEVLILAPALKRLATMCVQLMGDEELHLNLPGTMELIKLIMITAWDEAVMTGRPAPNGFIIEDFPCSRREAEAFEKSFYPMSLGIYFESRWWSVEEQKVYLDPELEMPTYFRRDSPYREREVEEVVDSWRGRSIKVLNMEDFAEFEAWHLINVVKEKLANPTTAAGSSPGGNDPSNDYANYAMQQLAQLYKCTDPNCKCEWSGQANQEGAFGEQGGTTGGVSGNGGDVPLVITCPLERPCKTVEEVDWTKHNIFKEEAPRHPKVAHSKKGSKGKGHSEETPPIQSTPEEDSRGSTPVTSASSGGEGSSSSKKSNKSSKDKAKKRKKGKKGSKDKTSGGSGSDSSSRSKSSKGKKKKKGKKGSSKSSGSGASSSPSSSKKSKKDKKKKSKKGSKSKSPTSPPSTAVSKKGSKHKKRKGSKAMSISMEEGAGSQEETIETSTTSTKSKSKKGSKGSSCSEDPNHQRSPSPNKPTTKNSKGSKDKHKVHNKKEHQKQPEVELTEKPKPRKMRSKSVSSSGFSVANSVPSPPRSRQKKQK